MPKKRRRFDRVPRGEPRLLEGARLFNAGAYFESHEVWEALWHEVEGEERDLLQALIQLAAAYHHLTHGNRAGASYLYGKGRARLARWAPEHAGIAVGQLLVQVDRHFARVQQGKQPVSAPSLTVEP